MVTIEVKSCDLHQYVEVFEITERKDGCIYKTKSTGKFILSKNVSLLNGERYTTSSVSTSLMKQDKVCLQIFQY